MKVLSTNIGQTTYIPWRGKQVKTGIFKYPVETPIFLDKEDVRNDDVVDRRYHGGVDKACYLFSVDHYPYWKELYPDLKWNYGMFGENLSVLGLDERLIRIGSIYTLGKALVQITQPRQPCYKLGVRFGTQKMLRQFIQSYHSGVYIRVLSPGEVHKGDILQLHKEHTEGITIREMFGLLYETDVKTKLAKKAINDRFVTDNNKISISNKYENRF